jgi:hypothetical protein
MSTKEEVATLPECYSLNAKRELVCSTLNSESSRGCWQIALYVGDLITVFNYASPQAGVCHSWILNYAGKSSYSKYVK